MDRIGLFGTGVMARGIAALCLQNAMGVVILSGSPDRAEALAASLSEQAPDGAVSTDPTDLQGCSLFLEATVEEAESKIRALQRVEAGLPPAAVMASSTSSLSITALASALREPARMIGLHFFNPVHRMPLVEVVAGLRCDPEAVGAGRDFAHALGKRPLRVPDGPGFLVNRLLIPYLNSAARLAESGYASAEDIDMAMTLGTGHPMGPFALIDLIGADVVQAIGRSLDDGFHRTCDAASPELRRRVALGWLGRKTGHGYFDYAPRAAG